MRLCSVSITIFILLFSCHALANESSNDTTTKVSAEGKTLMIYRNLFKVKRKEHIAAVQKLLLNNKVAKRAQLITIMLGSIVKTIEHAMERLKQHDLSDPDVFPSDPEVRDAMSQILENTALFTDLMVRFPSVARPLYGKNKKVWKPQMRKAIDFCHQNPVYEGDYQVLLHNLQQELGIGIADPTYNNPFVINPDAIEENTSEERKMLYNEAKRKKKLKDKKKKKGSPRLSRSDL